MSDIILKSGLRDRNTMRISMDTDGDMTLSLDTYVGSAAFHIASQAQIKQLRDYFDSHLAQPAAPRVSESFKFRVWNALPALEAPTHEQVRAAIEAALAQPGEGE